MKELQKVDEPIYQNLVCCSTSQEYDYPFGCWRSRYTVALSEIIFWYRYFSQNFQSLLKSCFQKKSDKHFSRCTLVYLLLQQPLAKLLISFFVWALQPLSWLVTPQRRRKKHLIYWLRYLLYSFILTENFPY